MEKLVTTDTMYLTEGGIKILAPYSKIHVLAKMDDNNCVVLAQFNPSKPPSIWLYYKMKIFYLISEDFVTYFRMALAHMGVPGWQLAVLKATLPEWSSEMIHILAPGIFENKLLVDKSELNIVDSSIFVFEDLVSDCEDVNSECDRKKPVKNKPKK
ncbi:hypothetical protein TcasGA2_TC002430 [Tribolium castaneum]|uniref:Uncharacterized protein n=2 Tax=Tribolium castaneum TaxID=7070 RepID=D6WIG3_TRICA|nr:PREDICTED: uncharacterized protein LOC103312509 [Tribolium castaneum]EEZ99673.1 hypothetical protein TcasGA2_TC002430 [Tribolium castaneum]|eukprot:XP_008191516.2 PREDICTED: uncharacterized protein LOC103312509 [Tribolium castaneum]